MLAASALIFFVFLPALIHGQVQATAYGGPTLFAWLQEFWIVRLALNLAGYASIIVPGYLLIRYVRQSGFLDRATAPGCLPQTVRLCVAGAEPEKPGLEDGGRKTEPDPKPEQTQMQQGLVLCWCAGGLLSSYLIWGLLQERIMAFNYGATETRLGEKFTNSQFLVFMNRILALIVASVYLLMTTHPRHIAPLFKYSYSSFSNIMSSWCQYEALKFVTFPVQVLAKSSKVIPVMLMGKLVSKKTYDWYEYTVALLISVGVSVFLLSDEGVSHSADDRSTTISGVLILIGYLTFDAFTSNWQGELFHQYKMSSMQMMAGVNLFSVLFTTVSLAEQGGFIESLAFMAKHSDFVLHVIVLSITSATGQLFIFFTISRFGPVTFTIIMTIRQAVAILLSCVIYHHAINVRGLVGIVLVFGAVLYKIYKGRQIQAQKLLARAPITLLAPSTTGSEKL